MTSVAAPICVGCTHRRGDLLDPRCDAFPDGIPNDILLSQSDHRQPHYGDSGIRFDPVDDKAAAYAQQMFSRG